MSFQKIGVVGTGRMGNPISMNLLKAGFKLIVMDVNREAFRNLIAMGAEAAESPLEVGQRAELIITSLPKNEIVQEVIAGPQGILAGAKAGAIVIDMSTTSPMTTRAIGKEATKRGVDFLDAPVSGMVKGAREGTLNIMVGGERTVFEKVRFVLEKIGKGIFYVGELGAGQSLKLVNNLISNLNRLTMMEGLVLGVKAGIDPKMMVEVLGVSSGNSFVFQYYTPEILRGNFESQGSSSVNLACKTLKLISEFADELDVPLFLTNLGRQIYNLGKAKGLGEESPLSIIKIYEELLGIQVRAR
jgi:3-hydroxyisobutyrate dehydrogenase-like beta-hydroxyacid dehydrogenase